MNKEVWKDIINYEGLYQVSNLGRVKSLKRIITRYNGYAYCEYVLPEKILTVFCDKRGYSMTFLYKNGKRKKCAVHRIVAEAFIPNPENKPQVNHIDGNKLNNCVDNLEWATNSENQKHAYKSGLQKPKFGGENSRARKVECIETGEVFNSITEATKKYKIQNANISACCRGVKKTAGGYRWKYKDIA